VHHRKRKKSKYLVAQMNLGAVLIGLVGLILLLVFVLEHLPNELEWRVFVVCLGALMACLAVQPWVRRTLSFWFSLAVSFVPQFFAAHWLAIHHPTRSRGGEKGSALISLLPGYLLGGVLFLLLQRLKPRQGKNAAS